MNNSFVLFLPSQLLVILNEESGKANQLVSTFCLKKLVEIYKDVIAEKFGPQTYQDLLTKYSKNVQTQTEEKRKRENEKLGKKEERLKLKKEALALKRKELEIREENKAVRMDNLGYLEAPESPDQIKKQIENIDITLATIERDLSRAKQFGQQELIKKLEKRKAEQLATKTYLAQRLKDLHF